MGGGGQLLFFVLLVVLVVFCYFLLVEGAFSFLKDNGQVLLFFECDLRLCGFVCRTPDVVSHCYYKCESSMIFITPKGHRQGLGQVTIGS